MVEDSPEEGGSILVVEDTLPGEDIHRTLVVVVEGDCSLPGEIPLRRTDPYPLEIDKSVNV